MQIKRICYGHLKVKYIEREIENILKDKKKTNKKKIMQNSHHQRKNVRNRQRKTGQRMKR